MLLRTLAVGSLLLLGLAACSENGPASPVRACREDSPQAGSGDWSSPVAIASLSGAFADREQLDAVVADSTGTLHMVVSESIEQNAGAGKPIRVSYARGTLCAWSPPEVLSEGDVLHASPRIAADPEGRIHVAWVSSTSSGSSQWATRIVYRRRDGAPWSAAEVLSDSMSVTGVSPNNLMDLLADGSAVHLVFRGSPLQSYHRVRQNGGWGPPIPLSWPGGFPKLVGAPEGGLDLVFVTAPQASEPGAGWQWGNVFIRSFRGGSWSRPVDVSRDPDTNSGHSQMVIDSRKVRHLVWTERAQGDVLARRIYYSRSPDGVQWTSSEDITPADMPGVYAYRPSLVVDGHDRLHVLVASVPASLESDHSLVYLRRIGEAWARHPAPSDGIPASHGDAHLVQGPRGAIHAVWRSSAADFYIARLTTAK